MHHGPWLSFCRQNEAAIGEAIREAGVARSSVFVTSKVSPYQHGTAKARVACQDILERLGTEYVVSRRRGGGRYGMVRATAEYVVSRRWGGGQVSAGARPLRQKRQVAVVVGKVIRRPRLGRGHGAKHACMPPSLATCAGPHAHTLARRGQDRRDQPHQRRTAVGDVVRAGRPVPPGVLRLHAVQYCCCPGSLMHTYPPMHLPMQWCRCVGGRATRGMPSDKPSPGRNCHEGQSTLFRGAPS